MFPLYDLLQTKQQAIGTPPITVKEKTKITAFIRSNETIHENLWAIIKMHENNRTKKLTSGTPYNGVYSKKGEIRFNFNEFPPDLQIMIREYVTMVITETENANHLAKLEESSAQLVSKKLN